MSSEDEDQLVAQIAAELDEDGVWVDDTRLEGQLSEREEDRLTQAVSDSDVPVSVIAYPLHYDGAFTGDLAQLGTLVHDARSDTPTSMLYLGTDGFGGADAWVVGSSSLAGYELPGAAAHLKPTDVGQQLLVAVDLANHPARLEAAYGDYLAELDTAPESAEATGNDPTPAVPADEGTSGVPVVGLLGALVLVAAAVAGLVRWRRARAEPGFRLPKAVVRRVHSARERNLRGRADAEVLALGEAIDATEMGAGAEQAWQQALDHYDAARRVRDSGTGVADAVGALVLAGRGRQALAAAERHAGFHPEPTCYFDPLHGQGSRRVRWSHGAAAVQVPACSQCHDALDQGRRPAVLELVSDGQSRPWYESDAEPWVSTGYGALDTDLVGALTRHRGRRA